MQETVSAVVRPRESFDMLSPTEIEMLEDQSATGLYPMFRQCSLAVLNSGSDIDDIKELMDLYRDFDIKISQKHNGLSLELKNAPASAFVDGKIIQDIRELLFAVLRDLVYTVHQYERMNGEPKNSSDTTNLIFHILRNAGVLKPQTPPSMAVVWGGHSVTDAEYEYTKELGYQLGLRKIDVCNGSGPGVMGAISKGGMKGHRKQRHENGLVCGISEPQILAAEVPNENLDALVVMPDIEKRLEAFIRYSTVTIICAGGVGTMEELYSILLCKLSKKNDGIPLPLIFTAPKHLEDYFHTIDEFIGLTLGKEAQSMYEIIIDDTVKVAERAKELCEEVYQHRLKTGEAFHFNWTLHYPEALQSVFEPSHENMAALKITPDMDVFERAVNLRSLMSGIVAGNVKRPWVDFIVERGPYEINVDRKYADAIDNMLKTFVSQGRMKIKGHYTPCYTIK